MPRFCYVVLLNSKSCVSRWRGINSCEENIASSRAFHNISILNKPFCQIDQVGNFSKYVDLYCWRHLNIFLQLSITTWKAFINSFTVTYKHLLLFIYAYIFKIDYTRVSQRIVNILVKRLWDLHWIIPRRYRLY